MTIANSIFTGTLGGLILHALYAMLSQNAVFGRGLGSSRLTKLVNDEDGDAGVFCVLLLVVQVLSGVLSWAASRWVLPLFGDARLHFRPLVLVVCICIVFFAQSALVVALAATALRAFRKPPTPLALPTGREADTIRSSTVTLLRLSLKRISSK